MWSIHLQQSRSCSTVVNFTDRITAQTESKWSMEVLYLIKEITGSVRWTSLWDKAGEGHAVQNLGQKVVLNEASLTKEGSLHNVRIRWTVRLQQRWEHCNLLHMDVRWNEKQATWQEQFLERDCKTYKRTNLSKKLEVNVFCCWNSGCKMGNKCS